MPNIKTNNLLCKQKYNYKKQTSSLAISEGKEDVPGAVESIIAAHESLPELNAEIETTLARLFPNNFPFFN